MKKALYILVAIISAFVIAGCTQQTSSEVSSSDSTSNDSQSSKSEQVSSSQKEESQTVSVSGFTFTIPAEYKLESSDSDSCFYAIRKSPSSNADSIVSITVQHESAFGSFTGEARTQMLEIFATSMLDGDSGEHVSSIIGNLKIGGFEFAIAEANMQLSGIDCYATSAYGSSEDVSILVVVADSVDKYTALDVIQTLK